MEQSLVKDSEELSAGIKGTYYQQSAELKTLEASARFLSQVQQRKHTNYIWV